MRIKATFINGFNKNQAEKGHRSFAGYVMNKRLTENKRQYRILRNKIRCVCQCNKVPSGLPKVKL